MIQAGFSIAGTALASGTERTAVNFATLFFAPPGDLHSFSPRLGAVKGAVPAPRAVKDAVPARSAP